MYQPTETNTLYNNQRISSSSNSRQQNQLSAQPTEINTTKQHAFGSDTEQDNSDSDEESTGFQVYKDNSSTIRYGHLPISSPNYPSSPTLQSQLNQSTNQLLLNNQITSTSSNSNNNNNYPPITTRNEELNLNNNNNNKKVNNFNNQDLVAIPALGNDWNKNESKNDKYWDGKETFLDKNKWISSKKNKLLNQKSKVNNSFREFLNGNLILFGWFNRFIAFGLFIFCLILGILLIFFLVPRIPALAYDNTKTMTGDSTNGLIFESLEPVKFSFNGNLNLAMIAKSSYIKPKISKLLITIDDLNSTSSNIRVATGSSKNQISISNKEYTPFSVDLNFSYSASSKTDPVWNAWHEACGHKWPGREDRPNLILGIIVEFNIQGRFGTFSERTILNNVTCPVELSASAA